MKEYLARAGLVDRSVDHLELVVGSHLQRGVRVGRVERHVCGG